jgi:hypothetical protein
MSESRTGSCRFCFQPGLERIPATEENPTPEYVCTGCWKLLQKKETAFPLMRGDMALRLRGKISQKEFDKLANLFFGEMSKWEPRN